MTQEATDGNDSANYGAAFVQVKKDDSKVDPVVLPTTPTTYEKKESGGVLGLMNEMKTDITTDMKEAEIEEKHANKNYGREMLESKESRAELVKTLEEKEATLA